MWAGMINCESTLPDLMELTIPYNSPESLTIAHARKSTKRNYQVVQCDLECKGHSTLLVTIEIGALGHSLTHFVYFYTFGTL